MTNIGKDVEQREHLVIAGGNVNRCGRYGKLVVLKRLKTELPYDPAITPGYISAENESTDFKRSIPMFTCAKSLQLRLTLLPYGL